MTLEIRPIAYGEVTTASLIVQGGSLAPEHEDESRVDDYWFAVEETRRRLGEVLVATIDGEVVGVCQLIVFPHFQRGGGWCAELESVHVRSDQRGHGVGTAMLAAAEDLARQRGCYRIQLTSRNVRLDAHRFYVTNGFDQTSLGFKKYLSD